MTKKSPIRHADAGLIEALGGPAEVARMLGLDARSGGTQRVHNWTYRGIPELLRLKRPDIFGAADAVSTAVDQQQEVA